MTYPFDTLSIVICSHSPLLYINFLLSSSGIQVQRRRSGGARAHRTSLRRDVAGNYIINRTPAPIVLHTTIYYHCFLMLSPLCLLLTHPRDVACSCGCISCPRPLTPQRWRGRHRGSIVLLCLCCQGIAGCCVLRPEALPPAR